MKIGLVLEGGGMRGLYTAGVLDGLTDAHWLPDYVVGVSAGADNAASYLSGQRGRNFRINTDYLKDKRYLSVHNFLRTKSLFGMDFIFHEIPNKLDPFDYKAFASCPCAFEVGVTEVETGKTAFLGREPMEKGDFSALRASSSIPVFSPIVEIDGKKYLDGGTSDPIPVRRALEWGCDRVVVVLTRERGYRKKPEGFRRVYRRAFRAYPHMIHTLDIRHQVYNQTLEALAEWERRGKALVIAPEEPLGIGRFEKDKEKLTAVYRLGVKQTAAMMEQIRIFSGKNE